MGQPAKLRAVAPILAGADPMSRPQFTVRTLLTLMLAVACFFGGIQFEREWQRRKDEAAALAAKLLAPPTGVILQTQRWNVEIDTRTPGEWSPPAVSQPGPTWDP
jgi:membrane protein DedA with SNARE-associated domain